MGGPSSYDPSASPQLPSGSQTPERWGAGLQGGGRLQGLLLHAPPSPGQASRALEEPWVAAGPQARVGPPSLGDVCTRSGPWSLPQGSFRGQGPSWECRAPPLLPAAWAPPGSRGEGAAGSICLLVPRLRFLGRRRWWPGQDQGPSGTLCVPAVSSPSSSGEGAPPSPPWEGSRGPQREEAESGSQGAWPSPRPSRRAARGSHGRALRERTRPQLSRPRRSQVHVLLSNKAGLQSRFENNSIKFPKEVTSLHPPQPPCPPPLLCLPGALGLEPAPGVVGGPRGTEPPPMGYALTLGVSDGVELSCRSWAAAGCPAKLLLPGEGPVTAPPQHF